MKMKKFAKNLGWYLGNRSITAATTLYGIGAASGDGNKIKDAFELPYKLATSVAKDEGLVRVLTETTFDLAKNIATNPVETGTWIAGGYVVGKALTWYSERRRQKAKYQK